MITDRKGFTLVEVITATLVIAAMAAYMFGAFVGARYIFRHASYRMQAFNFALEAQEKLKSNYVYGDSQLSIRTHTEAELGTIVRGDMAGLSILNTQLTYDVSEPEPDGYKKVTVRVNWEEEGFLD